VIELPEIAHSLPTHVDYRTITQLISKDPNYGISNYYLIESTFADKGGV
jgi:hypothetical protein